jgi:transcriptional/translational regulatory protein YebC/TACO1
MALSHLPQCQTTNRLYLQASLTELHDTGSSAVGTQQVPSSPLPIFQIRQSQMLMCFRWSKIKHDKGKEDVAKGKARSSLAKELSLASRSGDNARIQLAIANAKKASFPKASIEAAIARGQGLSSTGAALDSLTIEAMLPPSIAMVIDCQTDSKARTMQDMRGVLKFYGGTVTSTSYLFRKRGKIVFEKDGETQLDDVLDQAIEAGATDVDEDEEGRILLYTEPNNTSSVANQMADGTGLKLDSSEIVWDPNPDTMVEIDSESTAEKLDACIAKIQEDSSVQGVYVNAF